MTGSSKHALIIEDELVIGMEMQSVLSGLGFSSFAFASTAHQALEQARLRRPDLVTADVALLDGDGLDACAALEAACGPLPIICVTGQPDAVAGQGRALVIKPFTAADIARACTEVLGTPQAA
jgi:two-component system, response regulator PdtaR